MRNRISCIFLVGILTLSCFNFVSAEGSQNTQYEDFNKCSSYSDEDNKLCDFYDGPLLGGLNLAANNNSSTYLDHDGDEGFPVIAEDYTATWCENCVEVEEALEQVASEMSMTQLHFHKCCFGEGEYEDPFGTIVGDQWWDRRNGKILQPMVVINGGEPVIGSIAGTYENFKTLAEDKIMPDSADKPTFGFTWENFGNSTGKINWVLDDSVWGYYFSNFLPQTYTPSLFASLFIIEDSVYFPEGSNGLENYHYVVRDIIGLGNSSGEKEITLPEIYDGDDLTLVLVLELNGWGLLKVEDNASPPTIEENTLPHISVSMTLLCLMCAAYSKNRFRKLD